MISKYPGEYHEHIFTGIIIDKNIIVFFLQAFIPLLNGPIFYLQKKDGDIKKKVEEKKLEFFLFLNSIWFDCCWL